MSLKYTLGLLSFWVSLYVPISHASQQAAIASAHPLATEAGFEILNQGGNAFDAAVAISAVLAVVEPAGSGLGGGGFWLIHRAEDNFDVMIDGRETAPSSASATMYEDASGHVQREKSLNGALAAAIPGVPAALDYISNEYGKISLSAALQPAIRHAEHGFNISRHYQKLAQFRLESLRASPDASAIFLSNHQVPELGFILKQPDLANTLSLIAKHGHQGFYKGDIAQKLVHSVNQHGGIWTLEDLANYQVKLRQPIKSEFMGYEITSAALPSSGGLVLTSMLNQLALLPYWTSSYSGRMHLLSEVMRRAYYNRSVFLGDEDFVSVPKDPFVTKLSAENQVATIDINHASNELFSSSPAINKGEDTTHFSVIDQFGNRVSATLSINYPFGSGFVPEGTGILLNDEMDDFSSKLGSPNGYGLIGNHANAIAGNKRPLSSMTPTFIENEHELMIIGTPGGSRIISMVLLGILDFVEGKSAQDIVTTPRFHHQFSPNYIQVESEGFSDSLLQQLQTKGHDIKVLNRRYGNMQVITFNKDSQTLLAASDPRGEGSANVREIATSPLSHDALARDPSLPSQITPRPSIQLVPLQFD
jgi:gamma-glutamyltranspeptidase/glutathione hydrolase